MTLNLSFPLYRIYDHYRDAHYAFGEEITSIFAGLEPAIKAFGVELDQYKLSDPINMAPFPEVLHAVATTSSSRFSSVFKRLDDLSLIKEMISEIRAASKSRESRMQHTIQVQRDVSVALHKTPAGSVSEPDLKKALGQKPNQIPDNLEEIVRQKQVELEKEMRARVELMVEKEKELQERVEQMDAEIKRLERQNAELDQKMKKEIDEERNLREKEANLATEYEKKIKSLANELAELHQQKSTYEQNFAIKKAECEDELHSIQQALLKVKTELAQVSAAKTTTQTELESVGKKRQQNAEDIVNLASQLSEAGPLIDRNIKIFEYVMDSGEEMISSAIHRLMKTGSRVESTEFEGTREFTMPLTENLRGIGKNKDSTHSERCLLLDKLKQSDQDSAQQQQQQQVPTDGNGAEKKAEKYVIPIEYEADLSKSQVPVADWAVDALLSKCINQSSKIDPDTVFQPPQQKVTVYELFGISNHPYDNRTRQTQNWSTDKLTQKEIELYNAKMGFSAQKPHSSYHK
ncbi:hypothetical protein DHA2_151587 [Giardia duodenalis]|uniref:Uncharacterized protein n=1 Tax=Giardia intestinalis TaxID=5741 RepID=V6TM20_GIAIN|nr:hypothetical protein DHA2_151587 [Giardia intestinalis]